MASTTRLDFDRRASRRRAWRAVRQVLAERCRAPSQLTVSEWSDQYRILPTTSASPGRWRTSRAPYLRGIMDACSDIEIERVVLKKAAQIGYSELLLNVLGYYIDQDPAPILLVQISTGEAEKFSKERVAPLIADTPRLRTKVSAPKSRDSNNTIDAKRFPGGHLGIVGANAPTGLRSRPRRVILFDEVDGYPPSAGDEGDPIELAVKRTTTYWNAFILMGSTPTLAEFSRIDNALQECDEVRKYHVPCPHCGVEQVLTWSNVRWEKSVGEDGTKRHLPETAHYQCERCSEKIEERHRAAMLEAGRWIADEPVDRPRRVGFHISALYPTWVRWETLAREYLDALGNPELMQVFVNTRLGEVWEEKGHVVDAGPLYKRRETYAADPLPRGVVLITAGVDVQVDRLEAELVGWGRGEESWSLEYLRIPGDPSVGGGPWEQLDHVLQRKWKHPLGPHLRIAAMAIDAGYMTNQVLKYGKDRVARRVWPIHGVADLGRPIMDRPQTRNKLRVPNYPVGVDTAKSVLYQRLQIELEEGGRAGACHWPIRQPYDEEYFRQLTSEKVVARKTTRGHLKRMWVRRPGRRAEALDVRIYAMAALEGLQAAGLRLEQLAAEIEGKTLPNRRGRVRSPGIKA